VIEMLKPVLAAALLAALPTATAAAPAAGAPAARTMTCPIGGAGFSFTPSTSRPAIGTRPDGKPYGGAFPPALPECPDNGLVLYKDYTPEEVARLEPLVASEAYQALRRNDAQYYRAYWLMKEMGLGPEDYLWVLLQASWQAEGRPELRARYLAELADVSAKVAPNPADLNWIGMEGRAINALRELGRYDEALARLDKVPLDSLEVRIPLGQPGDAAVQQARQRRVWLTFFKSLRPAIERRDNDIEPLDLIPRVAALGHCIDGAANLAGASRDFCEREKVAVEQERTNRARLKAEMDALRHSRDASGR
jgi:hypothetical protein